MGDRQSAAASSLSADHVAVAAGRAISAGDSHAETGQAIEAAMAARATGENFPVALQLLPARHRAHLMAVYGFARTVDDIGDKAPVAERPRLLDELEADLARLYATRPGAASGLVGQGTPNGSAASRASGSGVGGNGAAGSGASASRASGSGPDAGGGPELSVIQALGPAVSQCGIPQQPFLDLIQANRQDQVVSRYPRFDDLVGYCRLSANPVGRIVLYVFGAFSPLRAALSDQVCTALQLAEHWQDVGEDYRAGRIYLPGEDMARYGCEEADLSAPRAPARLRALMAFETQRARAMLDSGAPLVGTLRGFGRAAVAGYVAGGRAALAAIAAADHDVLRATPRPGNRRTAAELLRCYATGR
jgi:squalene synthase HpnC